MEENNIATAGGAIGAAAEPAAATEPNNQTGQNNTQTAAGRTRLRKVAKECTNYGQRVQNSVFECQMDATKCRQVKNILENIIDKELDSLRFYYLGENYKNKVEHIGAKPGFDVTDTLIL